MSEYNLSNPKEFAYKVTKQTFALMNYFDKATFEKGGFPLEIYDATFSRLSGVLINADKVAATFNIRKESLPLIIKKSEFAFNKEMEYMLSKADTPQLSSAYTVKITTGKLKGKTPAELLIEDPENKNILNEHYKFLKSNLAKYPKNQTQMDAIMEAAKLLSEGKLSENLVTKEVVIPIYTPGFRPLVNRTREDGKSFVYDIKINWHVGSDNPVVIEVVNFYAPVIKTNDGLLNVKVTEKDAESEIKNTMSMSLEMWEDIIYNIKMQMRAFEITNFASSFKMAEQQEIANRQANANNSDK